MKGGWSDGQCHRAKGDGVGRVDEEWSEGWRLTGGCLTQPSGEDEMGVIAGEDASPGHTKNPSR